MVSGFDVTPALLDIARERVPAAALAVGDLEDALPFEPGSFDVVTAFNSVQYAADPVAAVKSMSQLLRPGGLISLLVWGPPERCQSGVMFARPSCIPGFPPRAALSPAPSPAAGSRTAPTGRTTCSATWWPGPELSRVVLPAWRRMRDSNSRGLAPNTLSKRAP